MFIKAINSSEQEVGRNVRSSKKKYLWKFSIDNIDQEIVLFISSLSGKKEVRHNGRSIHQESSLFCDFRYLYKIQKCLVTIAPRFDSYQLYLNNIPFAEYFNTHLQQNEIPNNSTLNNDNHDGYDLSPLKDSEQQKKNFQQPLQKFKITVPNEKTNQNKQQEILWKQDVNKDFANFGIPSTDNYFNNFGLTFDTPQKECKNTNIQIQQQNKQNEKPNPFFEFGQNQWSTQSQPQNKSNYDFNKQSSQIQSQQIKLFHSDVKPQTKIEQQFNNMIISQTQQQNRNQLFNQQNLSNYQQQNNLQQQQQIVNSQKQQQSQNNLLDFFESNQSQQNNIQQLQSQQQEFKKTHSQAFIIPLQSQNTSMNYQSQQFESQQHNQYQYPNYRTTQSLIPLTSSYQVTKKQMSKELEDMFDQPNTQTTLQKRSTPFDDDLFT